jgi:dCTP deaminase
MQGKELCRCLLRREESVDDETLSVDLSGTEIFEKDRSVYKDNIAAFKGKVKQDHPIDLWKHEEAARPDPNDYWECLEGNKKKRLLVEKDHFYILRSKQRLCLPEGIAVYCRAIDEAIGEMRIHYAGFAHPFFGKNRKDGKEGTPLIFEVRGHNIDVNLIDDERLARLMFYRMSKDCKKPDTEGCKKDEGEGDYNEQELQLSKFFRPWKISG